MATLVNYINSLFTYEWQLKMIYDQLTMKNYCLSHMVPMEYCWVGTDTPGFENNCYTGTSLKHPLVINAAWCPFQHVNACLPVER